MADAVNLGSVFGTVDLKDNTAQGVKSASDNIDKFDKSLKNKLDDIAGGFTSIGKKLSIGITAPIVAFGATAMLEFDKFNASIIKAGSYVNATAEQLEEFRNVAIEAAKGTGFSATQAAEALSNYVGGTVTAEEATRDLADLINLALIGGFDDLTEAAESTASALAVYEDEGLDTKQLMDSMAVVASDVTSNTKGYNYALRDTVASAKASGLSFKDLNVLISNLSYAGADLATVGTAINRALYNIQAPSKQGSEALAEFGLSVKGLKSALDSGPIELLEYLKKGFNKAQESGEGFAWLSKVIGSEAAPEFGMAMEANSEQLNEVASMFDNATGRSDELLKRLKEGRNPIDKMRDSFSQLQIAVAPVIEEIFSKFVNVIVKLIDKFNNMSPATRKIIVIFALLLSAIGPILVVIGSLIGAISTIAGVISAPVLAIGALIGMFVLAGLAIYKLMDDFGVIEAIINRVKLVIFVLKRTWETLVEAWNSPEVQNALTRLQTAWNDLKTALQPIFDTINSLIDTMFNDLNEQADNDEGLLTLQGAIDLLSGAINWLANQFEKAKPTIDWFVKVIVAIIEGVKGAVEQVKEWRDAFMVAFNSPEVQAILGELKKAWDDLKLSLSPLIESIKKLFGAFGGGKEQTKEAGEQQVTFGEKIAKVKDAIMLVIGIVKVFVKVFTFIIKVFTAIIGAVTSFIEDIKSIPARIGEFVEAMKVLFETLKNWIAMKWEEIELAFSNAIEAIVGFFVSLPTRVITFIQNLIDSVVYWFGYLWVWLPQKVSEIIASVIAWFASLPEKISTWLSETSIKIGEKWEEIKVAVAEKVSSIIESVITFFSTLPQRISDWLTTTKDNVGTKFEETKVSATEKTKSLVESVVQWFKDLPSKISEGLATLWENIKLKFEEVKTNLETWITEFIAKVLAWGENIGKSFIDGITSKISGLANIFKKGEEDAKKNIESKSPPKSGPFKDIDKWGENTGLSWAEGVALGMAGLTGMVGPKMAISAEAGMGDVNFGGGRSVVVNQDFHDNIIDTDTMGKLKKDILDSVVEVVGNKMNLAQKNQLY